MLPSQDREERRQKLKSKLNPGGPKLDLSDFELAVLAKVDTLKNYMSEADILEQLSHWIGQCELNSLEFLIATD